MKIIYYTNNGKVRTHNEDGLLIGKEIVLASMDEPKVTEGVYELLSVSDGMGGSKYGEVATKVFLTNIATTTVKSEDDLVTVVEKTQKELEGVDTGCAAAGIVIGKNSFVFNIGDCRVYKREDIFLNKLTKDHSVVQTLIDAGEISEEEALEHPKKNVLTSALTPTSKVDVYTKKISLSEGNTYLICTDGLWGEFGIDELEECFDAESIYEINTKLLSSTREKKLEDNISYILLEV